MTKSLKQQAAECLVKKYPEAIKDWYGLNGKNDIEKAEWIIEMFLDDEEFLNNLIKEYEFKNNA